MVLRAIEGFETKQITGHLDRIYTTGGGTPGAVAGRKTGSGLQGTTFNLATGALSPTVQNTWVIGFAIRKTTTATVGASATAGIQLQDSGGEQCSLVMVPGDTAGTFKLALKRDTVTIDTTTVSFGAGGPQSWHYFMLKVTVRTASNGSFELRHFDLGNTQTTVLSGSGVNLAHQGTDGADRVRIDWNSDSGSPVIFDDVFALDSTGSANNDFPTKPYIVLGALPQADGNQNDWIPSSGSSNYEMVDDPANSTDDNTKVTSETVGDIDLFDYEAIPALPANATVVGVQLMTTAAMAASGTRTLRPRIRSGGSEASGANFVLNDLVLRTYREVLEQDPVAAAAWTKSSVEAAEFGVETQA